MIVYDFVIIYYSVWLDRQNSIVKHNFKYLWISSCDNIRLSFEILKHFSYLFRKEIVKSSINNFMSECEISGFFYSMALRTL